jgi:hypothetical protein
MTVHCTVRATLDFRVVPSLVFIDICRSMHTWCMPLFFTESSSGYAWSSFLQVLVHLRFSIRVSSDTSVHGSVLFRGHGHIFSSSSRAFRFVPFQVKRYHSDAGPSREGCFLLLLLRASRFLHSMRETCTEWYPVQIRKILLSHRFLTTSKATVLV